MIKKNLFFSNYKNSIRQKLIIFFSLTVVVLIVVSSLLFSFFQLTQLKYSLIKKGVMLTETMGLMSENFIASFNFSEVEKGASALIQNDKEILYVILEGIDKNLIIQKDKSIPSQTQKPDVFLSELDLEEEFANPNMKIFKLTHNGHECIEILLPLKAGEFLIANLRIGLTTYYLNLAVFKSILVSIFLILGFSILGIFFSVRFSLQISNPILELKKASEEIRKKNFDFEIIPQTSDEIGMLAEAVNEMRISIKTNNTSLEELNQSLEQKVQIRTEQLNEMLDQLGKLYVDSENKRKEIESLAESRKKLSLVGQMAAGIVHDIKNPMATIKLLAEMSNSEDISNESRIENLNLIIREMDRLSDLAYEILDFSKGQLNLDIQELNLNEFIGEIEKFLLLDFDYLGVRFVSDLRYTGIIRVDKDRMRRVIVNIAKNAIEAMYDGKKKYEFRIVSDILANNIVLSLIDNGPGLPESVEQNIFQAFATEGKAKGTGLGLFMCKWIIEAHNGTLTYTTKRGEGTTFFINLPITN